jgi:predicted phosphodiesterase
MVLLPHIDERRLNMAVDVGIPENAIADITKVKATRIGLLSDDHCTAEDASDLPAEALKAFEGCDLIIQLGHGANGALKLATLLDRLETTGAKALSILDFSMNEKKEQVVKPQDDKRVAGLNRVIEIGGYTIGATHNLQRQPGPQIPLPPGGLPDFNGIDVANAVKEKFGQKVDVVAYASSHRPAAIVKDGVLFVNPGSTNYPKGPGRVPAQKALGTVGILDFSRGAPTFEVIELSVLTNPAPGAAPMIEKKVAATSM